MTFRLTNDHDDKRPEPPDMTPEEAQAEATRRWGNLGVISPKVGPVAVVGCDGGQFFFGRTYRAAFARADAFDVAAREAREREHAGEAFALLRALRDKGIVTAFDEHGPYLYAIEALLAKVEGEKR